MRVPRFEIVRPGLMLFDIVIRCVCYSFRNSVFLTRYSIFNFFLAFSLCLPAVLSAQSPHQSSSNNINQTITQFYQAEAQQNDMLVLSLANEIGMQMLVENELDSALYYFDKAIGLAKRHRQLSTLKDLTDAKARVIISKGELEKAIPVLKQIFIYEDQLQNHQGKAETYAEMANVFRLIGKFDSCTYFLQLATDVAPNPHSNFIKSCQAKLYRDIGAYDKAFALQMEMLKVYEAEGHEIAVFNILIELSQILLEQGQLDKAETFAKRALVLAVKLELNIYKGRVYTLLGNIALQQEQSAKAKSNFEQALLIYQQTKRPLEVADIYLALGKLEQQEGQIEQAGQHFDAATRIFKDAKERRATVNAVFANADLDLEKRQPIRALQALNSILSFVESMEDNQNLKTLYKLLAKAYHQNGNLPLAYAYMEKYDQVKDELYDLERSRMINELEIKYQIQEKEQNIRELEQAAKLRKTQLRFQTFYIVVLIVGAIAFLGLALIFYRNWQKNKLISNQKAALDTVKIKQLEQEKRLIALQSLIEGQEQERQRIASDLHDGLGALLSTVRLQFDSVKTQQLPEQQLQQFQKSKELLAIACRETREIAHNMMPGSIQKFGILSAIKDMCDAIIHAQGIQVDFQSLHFDGQLPDDQKIAIFRIVQELLNNIIKHAQATEVLVQITQINQQLEIIVEDDWLGFSINETENFEGMGLSSVRSRVEYLQGEMEVESVLEEGSTFTILIPLQSIA